MRGPRAPVSWRLYDVVLLRSSGVPFETLARLADPGAAARSDAAHDAAARVDAEAERFERALWRAALGVAEARHAHGSPIFKQLYGLARAVRKRRPASDEQARAWARVHDASWPASWNAVLAAAADARAAAARAYERAYDRARAMLGEAFADERLRHAVYLSNPGFFEGGFGHVGGAPRRPTAAVRNDEATAHRYLSRFCAKCETTSFFGPVVFARVDDSVHAPLETAAAGREEVFLEASAWLVRELGDVLAGALPPESLRPRRNPLFAERDGALVRVLDGRAARVDARALALWRALDGERDLTGAARAAGVEPERARETLGALGGLAVGAVEVPATELRPLDRLAALDAPDGPARALARERDAAAAAPWPERRARFEAAESLCASLGLEPRRHAGRHYADRTVLHEDRSGPLNCRVTLGAPAEAALRRALDSVLPLCALGALVAQADARAALRAVLDGRARPLAQLAALDVAPVTERGDRLAGALRALVAAAPVRAGEVRLSRADVCDAVAESWRDVEPDARAGELACLPGADVMAAGADLGAAKWVLSELHDDSSSVFGGFFAALHPDPDGLFGDFCRAVAALVDVDGMATIVSRRRTKHVTPELPGLSIELSGRSCKPRAETAPISAAAVEADARRIVVGGRRYRLYPGDLSSPLHRALALPCVTPVPVDLGAFTPRVVIDDAVYQRARWRVELPRVEPGAARWEAFQALRRERALPRRVFVRHPAEPKPLFLDFADPLGVDCAGRLPPAEVSATEMLPGPDDLWWRPDGRAQCAELRVACLVTIRAPEDAP